MKHCRHTCTFIVLPIIMPFMLALCLALSCAATKKPNILIIYVDDVGYNDIGCYEAKDPAIETPHIDQLAREGMRFTNWISPSPVCAPSRAALLTGRYPMRNGVPTGMNDSGVFGDDHVLNFGLQSSEYTLAEMLKDVGYKTAMFGKSHLGFSPKFFPNHFGFDTYYGSLGNYPVGGTCVIWENDKIVDKTGKFQEVHNQLTERTIAFMKESKNEKKPFFIYLSHYLAHGPWAPNRKFATDAEWKTYQRTKGNLRGGGDQVYPALIRELDWHVGQVMAALKELSLDESTLVFFISDNGPWLPAGSAWPLGGSKFNTYEGGHRVPAIARWPGTIPANQASDSMRSTMDVFPTVAKLADGKMPDGHVIDGKDARSALIGEKNAKGHDVLYYYNGHLLEAVREGQWKLHLPRKKANQVYWAKQPLGGIRDLNKPFLFNLSHDLAEKNNVADQHPEVVQRLLKIAEEARSELGDWNRKGSDQKTQQYKGDPNNPKRYPRVKGYWLDFLKRQGVEIPDS